MKTLLLSGGMDSAALAYWLNPDLAITVDYGQAPASGEIKAAREIAKQIGIAHEIIVTDTKTLGSGLMSGDTTVTYPAPEYWPLRNQLLITLAAMRTTRAGGGEVYIGTVSGDDRHSDGRPEFLDAMNALLGIQEPLVTIHAPAAMLTSVELIKASQVPASVLGWTTSCHVTSPGCGECPGCIKHIETRDALFA